MSTYDFNDIARYLEGLMQPDELNAFEQALSADASLQEKLSLYKDMQSSLAGHFSKDELQEQLQGSLQQMRKEFFPGSSAPAKSISAKPYLRYAIALAAVFTVGLVIWSPWKPGKFEKYADTQMPVPIVRGLNADTLLQQAAVSFNKKEYAAASALLQKVVQERTGDNAAHFYYGVSLMQTGRLDEARNIFDTLYQGASVFKYEAVFYKAFTYLKDNNRAACREWLQKIPPEAGAYKKAQELLRDL
jgi:predicted Zn-dependent protease